MDLPLIIWKNSYTSLKHSNLLLSWSLFRTSIPFIQELVVNNTT
jgi:hypothetical protein